MQTPVVALTTSLLYKDIAKECKYRLNDCRRKDVTNAIIIDSMFAIQVLNIVSLCAQYSHSFKFVLQSPSSEKYLALQQLVDNFPLHALQILYIGMSQNTKVVAVKQKQLAKKDIKADLSGIVVVTSVCGFLISSYSLILFTLQPLCIRHSEKQVGVDHVISTQPKNLVLITRTSLLQTGRKAALCSLFIYVFEIFPFRIQWKIQGFAVSGEGPFHSLLTQAVEGIWSQRDATAHVHVCADGERERQIIDRKRERAIPGKLPKTKD